MRVWSLADGLARTADVAFEACSLILFLLSVVFAFFLLVFDLADFEVEVVGFIVKVGLIVDVALLFLLLFPALDLADFESVALEFL